MTCCINNSFEIDFVQAKIFIVSIAFNNIPRNIAWYGYLNSIL